jgi:predicted nucleotidyltransferase
MKPCHGLTAKTITRVTGVLERYPAVEKAVLFGSRAKSTHKPGSDIDLALVGPALDWRTVGRIYDALDDLLLPYRFSVIIYGPNTDPEVAAHIKRVGLLLLDREHMGKELLQR